MFASAARRDGSGSRLVKVYGERNSGTQYLQRLIAANLEVHLLRGVMPRWAAVATRVLPGKEWVPDTYFALTRWWNLGWKHGPLEAGTARGRRRQRLTVVTIVKNPYAWLLSLHKRPYHRRSDRDQPFVDFVREPWPTVRRDRHAGVFPSPVEMWNFKVSSYFEAPPDLPVIQLRYEDVLADPAAVIDWIGKVAGVARRHELTNIHASTKEQDMDFERYRHRYVEEQWRDELDRSAITEITRRLDASLVARAGYRLL